MAHRLGGAARAGEGGAERRRCPARRMRGVGAELAVVSPGAGRRRKGSVAALELRARSNGGWRTALCAGGGGERAESGARVSERRAGSRPRPGEGARAWGRRSAARRSRRCLPAAWWPPARTRWRVGSVGPTGR
ncbi:hypothetical protein U9M48_006992 [Paspalum notatum var. saurae]|uniref:Uncharacterized protein n=1 Tax=Paspalum notatum var. saurae TaxID=547442 RepID=A0AAQ3PUI3_PASNO